MMLTAESQTNDVPTIDAASQTDIHVSTSNVGSQTDIHVENMPCSHSSSTKHVPPVCTTQHDSSSIALLHQFLSLPDSTWKDVSPQPLTTICLCKICVLPASTSNRQPLAITHCFIVHSDLTWSLHVNNHFVSHENCSVLSAMPLKLESESLNAFLSLLNHLNICCGQPDSHFILMLKSKKGKIASSAGDVKAYIDDNAPILLSNGEYREATIRTSSCEILVNSADSCSLCLSYRSTLRAMYSRWNKKCALIASTSTEVDVSSHGNERYMSTPERKEKMRKLKMKVRESDRQVQKLRDAIKKLSNEDSESIDTDLHSDFLAIMNENNDTVSKAYVNGSFAKLFWDEQLKAASASATRRCWHPLIIKWCLNLKLLSSTAYHTLRTSGFVQLPSERTLRDYGNFFKSHSGFYPELNEHLKQESSIESIPDEKRYVVLLMEEMKIKEDLVFDKYSGHLIGFTSLGDVNDMLLNVEQKCNANNSQHPPVSKNIFVLLVRGLFFKLEFPYAHFGTHTLSGDMLFPIVWEAIQQLEGLGFKVICITGDGTSVNRKFFRMHDSESREAIVYKTCNPYANPEENRWLYFFPIRLTS